MEVADAQSRGRAGSSRGGGSGRRRRLLRQPGLGVRMPGFRKTADLNVPGVTHPRRQRAGGGNGMAAATADRRTRLQSWADVRPASRPIRSLGGTRLSVGNFRRRSDRRRASNGGDIRERRSSRASGSMVIQVVAGVPWRHQHGNSNGGVILVGSGRSARSALDQRQTLANRGARSQALPARINSSGSRSGPVWWTGAAGDSNGSGHGNVGRRPLN